jgi:hypothetical protein
MLWRAPEDRQLTAQLSARTLCIFAREFSSFRRQGQLRENDADPGHGSAALLGPPRNRAIRFSRAVSSRRAGRGSGGPKAVSTPSCMANCKSLSISWISRNQPFRAMAVLRPAGATRYPREMSRSAGRRRIDRRRADDRQTVPFSCRLEDATGGNLQQAEATSSNSQRLEVKAFRQQAATGSNSQQHAATRPKPRC